MQRLNEVTILRAELDAEAQDFYDQRKFSAAITHYESAVAKTPNKPELLVSLSIFLALRGMQSEAQKHLLRVMEIIQFNLFSLNNISQLFTNLSLHSLAYTAYMKIIECHTKSMPRDTYFKAAKAGLLSGQSASIYTLLNSAERANVDTAEIRVIFPHIYQYQEEFYPCTEHQLRLDMPLDVKDIDVNSTPIQKYLFALKDLPARRHLLEDLLANPAASKGLQLLAGLAICKIDANYLNVFIEFFTKIRVRFTAESVTISDQCTLAIAAHFIYIKTKKTEYRNSAAHILNNTSIAINSLPPNAIPLHLRNDFFEVILDNELSYVCADKFFQIENLKLQYLKMITDPLSDLSFKTRLNLAVQALLCDKTRIGRLMAVPQSLTATTLISGTKFKIVEFLNRHRDYLTPQKNLLNAATMRALRETLEDDPDFFFLLNGNFHRLATALKTLLIPVKPTTLDYSQKQFDARDTEIAVRCLTDPVTALTKMPRNRGLYYFPFEAICLERLGEHASAKKELTWAISQCANLPIYMEDMRHFAATFFKLGSYRLAHEVYSKIGLLTDIEITQAFSAALASNLVDEARAFLNRLETPTLATIYLAKANERRYELSEARYACLTQHEKHSENSFIDIHDPQLKHYETLAQLTDNTLGIHKLFLTAYLAYKQNEPAEVNFLKVKHACEDLIKNKCATAGVEHLHARSIMYLGLISLANKDFEKALKWFEEGCTKYPSPQLYFLRIKTLLKFNAPENNAIAIKYLSDFKPANDQQPIFYLLSLVLLSKIDPDARRILLQEAKQLTNKYPTPVQACTYALVHDALGDTPKARELLAGNINPLLMTLTELPLYLQEDYVNLLLTDKYTTALDTKEVDTTSLTSKKIAYVEFFKRTKNLDLAVQVFCRDTPVGQLFYCAQGFRAANCLSGKLKLMFEALNQYLSSDELRGKQINIRIPTTIRALIRENSNSHILESAKVNYPAAYELFVDCITPNKISTAGLQLLPPPAESPCVQSENDYDKEFGL